MSSMLKKTGGGGFKPRVPIARRRPQPSPAASTSTAPAVEPQLSTTPAQESTPQPSQDVADSPSVAESRPEPSQSPKPSAQQRQPEQQEEAPPRAAEPATPSSAPDTSASSTARVAKPSKGTTRTVKPTATTETSTSVASLTPADTSLPTPADDTVTPSIEIDEASSTAAPTAKAQGKAKANPRKPVAPKQPRKRKVAAVSGEGEAETGAEETAAEGDQGPAKKTKTAPRKKVTKKKTTTNGADGQSEAEGGQDGATTASRRRSQRTHKAAIHVEQIDRELEAGSDNDEEGADRSAVEESDDAETTKKPKKPRRKRSVTPEDAENIQIDPQTMTLAELTRNMRTGKRWEKAHLIEQVEQERKREMQKKRLIKLGKLKEGEDLPNEDGSEAGGTPVPGASSTPVPVAPPKSPTPPPLPAGPQMRVVNGVMVVDETTTQYDRYAEADAERENYESKEEHEFSRRTTQRTNMTRKPQANFWAPEETEKFYYGLRMFGTDFGMISKMFGGAKSRRQVKLKFNREERANPVRVNKCIIGEKDVAMNLDAVGGGEGLEESADIKDELLREQNEREAQAKALEDEVAAEARRKREELMGKRKGDRGKGHHEAEMEVVDEDTSAPSGAAATATKGKAGAGGRTKDPETLPGAKYGVGTDPDVIDETDLPAPATRGGRRGRGGRGGRRGGKAQIFASGIGAD